MRLKSYSWLVLVLLPILFSCNHEDKERGKSIFRLNLSAGLSSLDPAFSKDQPTMWMCHQLFNGLVQVNEKLEVVPCIANKWEISEDGLTYIFYLRNDVYFHENELFKSLKRKVVAQDFVYSLNRIIDENVASTGGWLFNGKVRDVNPFEAVNDTVFVIHLKSPFKPLLGLLTLQYCSVVPKEVVEYYGKDFRKHPVGTGPFKMVRWEENNALVLNKNDSYFETDSLGKKYPFIDGVRVSFIKERAVEFLQFSQGGFDMVSGVDRSFIDHALTPNGELKAQWKGKFRMERVPYLNTEYLGVSMTNPDCKALKNKLVRQAINYAIDRKKMLTFLRNGVGKPATAGMIPVGLPGFDSSKVKGYTFDIEKAKLLLAKAGYPNGKGLGELILYTNPMYQDLTEFIAKSLQDIGFKIKVDIKPASFVKEAMMKNEADFFRASWIGDYPDAENYLALFYGLNGAPPNYTFFRNSTYDALYEASMKEINDDKRYELYQAMERIIIEEAPVVPLFYDEIVRFSQNRVKNFPTNAMNLLELKSIVLEN